jgi:hypothetical protein
MRILYLIQHEKAMRREKLFTIEPPLDGANSSALY